jgi:hypothetical protein
LESQPPINTTLTKTLADEVSPVLIDLQTESESNWPVLAAAMGCSQSVSPAGFWYGLWEKLLGEPPEQDSAMDVRLLDTFACSVVRNVVDRTGRIPNGLKGDDAALADVESLCLSVNLTYLANVAPALLRWELFVDKFPLKDGAPIRFVDGCSAAVWQRKRAFLRSAWLRSWGFRLRSLATG